VHELYISLDIRFIISQADFPMTMSDSPATEPDPATFVSAPFDYLVVGGGTADLVVAARLSEDPAIRVGVLEAGPAAFDDPIIDIPGRFGDSLGTKYDWQFETIRQPGINGRKLAWPRGRVLGGTSALNFMTWNRGSRKDYDKWEQLGNDGWGWEGLLSVQFSSPSRCADCLVAHCNADPNVVLTSRRASTFTNPQNL